LTLALTLLKQIFEFPRGTDIQRLLGADAELLLKDVQFRRLLGG
jgi:hypothetical protein